MPYPLNAAPVTWSQKATSVAVHRTPRGIWNAARTWLPTAMLLSTAQGSKTSYVQPHGSVTDPAQVLPTGGGSPAPTSGQLWPRGA